MSIVCTICQDLVTERPQSLPDEEELQINAVTCGHLFHRSCILEWFRKVGNQLHASGKCPVCKADVTLGIRIFPSGDEDSTKMSETLGKAKACSLQNSHLQGELDQINKILEETGCQLENEQVNHEILKFEFNQKVQENDQLQRQLLEKNKLLELSEETWRGIVDKLTSERHDALEKLKVMESQISVQKLELLEEQTGLEEKTQDMIEQADKSCQTDGRDAAILQARLVSYKSCLLHMESEVRLLEEEYGKLEIEQSSANSKTNYDWTMELSGDEQNKKEASIWDDSLDSNKYISLGGGGALDISANSELGGDQDGDWSHTVSPVEVTNDHLDDDIDGFMIEETVGLLEDDGQSNHTEEFSDAPLWNIDVEQLY